MPLRRIFSVVLACLGLTLLLAPAAFAQWVFKLEPNHSSVSFSVPIVGGLTRVTGNFREFEVDIVYDEADVTSSSVAARIKAYSIDTGIDMRDKDLRGAQFFDVDHHPELTFKSKRIEKRGDGWVAVGDLTMRGVTKEIELSFVITGFQKDEKDGLPVLGVSANAKLNRDHYGIGTGWQHTAIPNFIGDEVTIEIFMWTRRGQKKEKPSAN